MVHYVYWLDPPKEYKRWTPTIRLEEPERAKTVIQREKPQSFNYSQEKFLNWLSTVRRESLFSFEAARRGLLFKRSFGHAPVFPKQRFRESKMAASPSGSFASLDHPFIIVHGKNPIQSQFEQQTGLAVILADEFEPFALI